MSEPVKTKIEPPTKEAPERPGTPWMVGGPPPGSTGIAGNDWHPGGGPGDPKGETSSLLPPTKKPKPGCKRCQGRGFEGQYPTTGPGGVRRMERMPCRCVKLRK